MNDRNVTRWTRREQSSRVCGRSASAASDYEDVESRARRWARVGHLGLVALAFLAGSVAPAEIRPPREAVLPSVQVDHSEGRTAESPEIAPFQAAMRGRVLGRESGRLAPDTLSFGYVGEDGFALAGEVWTFDHGGSDPLEGWYGVDVTAQSGTWFRHLDSAAWEADPFQDRPVPLLRGAGSAWLGAFPGEAREACWTDASGAGYGNTWAQALVSPVFTYDGASDVSLSWTHFTDTELEFDYSYVYLRTLPSGEETELRKYTDRIGLAADHPLSPPIGAEDEDVLTAADFAGATSFQVVFAFTSDGTWSDEDGLNVTEYGACGFDDVVLENVGATGADSVGFAFETGLEGWMPEPRAGVGSFLGVAPLSAYTNQDPCACNLEGMVLELHDGSGDGGFHPVGQHEYAVSPPVDVLGDVLPFLGGAGDLTTLARWDQYSEMPRANGVFYRPGAYVYPWTCEVTGAVGWSPRVGRDSFYFVGDAPACRELGENLSLVDGEPVPTDIEQVRFVYEVFSSCDAFGVWDCTGTTNATPLIDNVRLAFTRVPAAPAIAFDIGLRYQDGFPQGTTVVADPARPGNADVSRNIVGFGNTAPFILGDSIQVTGPVVTNSANRWEADLWFRMPRVGPYASLSAGANYRTWRDRVADGFAIDPLLAGGGPVEFTWGAMDSSQIATNAFRNKFCSYFREDDDDFVPGSGELSGGNEIIADGVLLPGTQVEYFITTNYVNTPDIRFFLPDTSGGFFLEFEILPGFYDDGQIHQPEVLYIDGFEGGAEPYIEEALGRLVGRFDRYDYGDPTTNWKAPLARGSSQSGANNGAWLGQLLGYRTILVNTGNHDGAQLLWPEDWALLSDWLDTVILGGNAEVQGLVLNGDGIAEAIATHRPALAAKLGFTVVDDSYREYAGDEGLCVALEPPAEGAAYGTTYGGEDYAYDAGGNGCPNSFDFDVLGATGAGSGNRVYVAKSDGEETPYAQVVRDAFFETSKYRAVVDGVSWHHLLMRDPEGECVPLRESVVDAIEAEMGAALHWIESPASGLPGAVGGPVTALLPARPNPFPHLARLSFQLATDERVEIAIFDAQGRRVRTLLDEVRVAGTHRIDWDGRDDDGHEVPSGLYWYRMKTEGYERSAQLVRLR